MNWIDCGDRLWGSTVGIDCGDHDDQVDRDHGVRELDALRLQDGYLLCVMDCFIVVVGLAIARWAGFLRVNR